MSKRRVVLHFGEVEDGRLALLPLTEKDQLVFSDDPDFDKQIKDRYLRQGGILAGPKAGQ